MTLNTYLLTVLFLGFQVRYMIKNDAKSYIATGLGEVQQPKTVESITFVVAMCSVCAVSTITLLMTMVNCSFHLRALLLIEDFAPKYLFEVIGSSIQLLLILVQTLVGVAE